MTYCDIAPGHPLHGPYHDREYGFPTRDETRLFERLVLEINQAGLSWLTVLRKREAFLKAFDGFDVDRVAAYGRRERARLLADAGIVRNQLKIDAAIENARRIAGLRESHGGFARWLKANHPLENTDVVGSAGAISANGIGNKKMAPCKAGSTSVDQRENRGLRRSRQNSCAVR